MKGKTQLTAILEHLKKYGEISSYDAFQRYGITRLSGQIFKLRKRGYKITSVYATTTNRYGTCSNYVTYKLIGDNEDEERKEY